MCKDAIDESLVDEIQVEESLTKVLKSTKFFEK